MFLSGDNIYDDQPTQMHKLSIIMASIDVSTRYHDWE